MPEWRKISRFRSMVCDPGCVDDNPRLLSDLPLVAVIARAAVFGLVLGLAILDGTAQNRPGLLLGLLLVAILASIPVKVRWLTWWRPVLEALAATWLIAGTGPLEESLLPYLAAPALAAGLLVGVRLVVLATGMSAAVFVVSALVNETP